MPWGNRTGPAGFGLMSGRALGYCAGYPVPGFLNPVRSWGYGPGFGRGFRGFWGRGGRGRFFAWGAPFGGGAWFGPAAVPFSGEADVLKEQAAYLENALSEIKKRIGELESKPKEE